MYTYYFIWFDFSLQNQRLLAINQKLVLSEINNLVYIRIATVTKVAYRFTQDKISH